MTTKQCHCTLIRSITSLNMQWFPRTFFFIFTDAESVLCRVAHRRFGNLVRLRATEVDDHKPQRATNRCIGPESVPQSIMTTVHPNLLANRTVDNHHRRGGESRDI